MQRLVTACVVVLAVVATSTTMWSAPAAAVAPGSASSTAPGNPAPASTALTAPALTAPALASPRLATTTTPAEYALRQLGPKVNNDVSIQVGADGLAVIAYTQNGNGSVWIARCLDHNCTAVTRQQIAGGIKQEVEMAISPTGNPILTYVGFGPTDGTLFVTVCDDPACTTSTTAELALDAADAAVTVGADGNPVVAVAGGFLNRELSVVACVDPVCSQPPTTSVVVPGLGLGEGATLGATTPAITLGDDGHPVISYREIRNSTQFLGLAVCGDPQCTVATTQTAWQGGFNAVTESTITLGIDGHPVVVWAAPNTAGGNDLVMALRCSDAACGTTNVTTIYRGQIQGGPGIAVGDNGGPIVAFTSIAPGGVRHLRTVACSDPACADLTTFIHVDNGTQTGSSRMSIAIRDDASPVIVSRGNQSMELLSCADSTCAPDQRVDVTDVVEVQEALQENVVIGFSRSGPLDGSITIPVTFVAGTADGTDVVLTGLAPSVTIGDGEDTVELTIPLLDDTVFEGLENFTIQLGEVVEVAIPNRTVTVNIDDPEDIPSVEIVIASGPAEFVGDEVVVPVDTGVGLKLQSPAAPASPATYRVFDVPFEATPSEPGAPQDYEAVDVILTIPAGETESQEFFLDIEQPADLGSGITRSFFLHVENSLDLPESIRQVRIDNPLDPPATFQRDEGVPRDEPLRLRVQEGTGESTSFELTLTKDQFIGTDTYDVDIVVSELAPEDEQRVANDVSVSDTTLTFTPTQPTQTVLVTIAGNTVEDDTFEFSVSITNDNRLNTFGVPDDIAIFNVIDDDAGDPSDADAVRGGIFDWFSQLIQWIRGLFVDQSDLDETDLPDFATPVAPVEVFDLEEEIGNLVPPLFDPGADTLDEAVADFEAAGCPVDFAAGGAGGATAATGDDVLQVRCPTSIAQLVEAAGQTASDINPLTPDVLQDLAVGIGLDPTIDWTGDVQFEVVSGFDAQGLYVLGSSGLDLRMVGDGTLTGSGDVLGIPDSTFAGTAGADLTISLDMGLDPDERIRITQPGDLVPQQLVPVAEGTASMNLAAELPNTALDWNATWNVTNDDNGATTVTTVQDVTILQELPGFTSPTSTTPTVELQGTSGERDGQTGWFVTGATQAEDGLQLGGFTVTSLRGDGFVNATTVDLEITATIEIGSGDQAVTVDVVLEIDGGDWTATADVVADTFTVGPITLVGPTLDITAAFTADPESFAFEVDFTAASARIADTGGSQVAELTGITGELSGSEQLTLSADAVTTSVGNALEFALGGVNLSIPATDGVLFSVATATATAPGLGGLQVAVTDLRVHDDGRFSATSASVTQPSGIARSIGLAGLIPVDITALTLDFTNVDPVTGEVVDLSEFTIAVDGTVDLGGFADLPFDPVVQLGADTITPASPPEDRDISFSAFVESLDPLVISPLDLGPISLGLQDLEIGTTTLSAVVTADGYAGGVLQPAFSGEASIIGGFGTIEGEVTAELDGVLIDGPTGPEIDASAVIGFGTSVGGGVSIDVLSATLELRLGVDDGTPFIETDLVEVSVEAVDIEFGTFADVSLTDTTLDLTPDHADGAAPVVFEIGGALAEPGSGASIEFNESLGVFAGWGGRVGGFGINTNFEPVLLDGFFAEVTVPGDELFGLPDFLPLSIDEIGFSLPDALAPGDVLTDALNGLRISITGGLNGTPAFPVSATAQDLVVDLGRLAEYDPSMGFDVATFPIQNLNGVRFAIEPELELGVATVSGELTFGVVDVTTDTGVEEVLYGRVSGNLSTPLFESGADVVISEYGPVLIRVTSPAGIPLGPTGLILTSVTGAAAFGDVQLPAPPPGEPEQLLSVIVDLPTDADLDDAGIADAIAPAVAAGTPTWTQGFAVALEGELEHIAAPGMFTGTVTLATSIASPLDPLPPPPQFVGVGELEVFGLPLGDGVEATGSLGVAGVLLDFADPFAPQIDFAFRSPSPGSPLATIMPTQTTVAAQLNTDGIATGVAAGIAAFVDTFAGTALDGLAAHLEADRVSPLSELVLDLDGDGDIGPLEDAVVITGPVLGQRLAAIVAGVDGAANVDELIAALGAYAATLTAQDATALFGGFLDTVATASEAALRAVGVQFNPSFVLRGAVQPVLFGIPIGGPDESIEIRIDTTSFSFEHTTSIVDALKSGGGVADVAASIATLGVTDELTFDVSVPLSGQADLIYAGGGMETLDPNDPDWFVGISGSISQFGIGAQVSGFLVSAGNQTFLDTQIERRWESDGTTPPDPGRIQLIRPQDYDTLLQRGGLIIDARLEIPRLLTDPVALLDRVPEALPTDPAAITDWFDRFSGVLGETDTPIRATLLIPGLGGVIDGTQNPLDWASGISFTGVLEGTRGPGDTDPVAKLLSIPIGEGTVIIDSSGIAVTANVPLLGLDAEFALGMQERPNPVPGGDPIVVPVGGVDLQFASGEIDTALERLGLPAVFSSVGADLEAGFRAYTPGFNPESGDLLERDGGVELTAALGIDGIVDEVSVRASIFNLTGEFGPDFVFSGVVDGVVELAGIDIERVALTVAKNGPDIGVNLDGQATIFEATGFGAVVNVEGDLNVTDLTGRLRLDVDQASLPDAGDFALEDLAFLIELVRNEDDELVGSLGISGAVQVPDWLTGTGTAGTAGVAGCFDTQGDLELRVDVGTLQLAGGDTTTTSDDLIITGTGAPFQRGNGAPCTLPPDALEISDDGVRLVLRVDGGVGSVFVDGAIKMGGPNTPSLFEVTGALSTDGTGALSASINSAALDLPIDVDAEVTLRLDGPDGFELLVRGRIVLFEGSADQLVLAEANLRIDFRNGILTVAVPEPGIRIDLGFASLRASGFVDSTGGFSLTGAFTTEGSLLGVSWFGSIEVTITNTGPTPGIRGAFEGRVSVLGFTAEAGATMSSNGRVSGFARADLNGDGSFAGFTACFILCVDIAESADFSFNLGGDGPPDTTPPTMAPPDDVVINTTSDFEKVPVDYIPPLALDDSSGEIRARCNRPPGSLFELDATTRVTCTASDAAGNRVTRSFDVSVTSVFENSIKIKVGQEQQIEKGGLDPGTVSKLIIRSTPRQLSDVTVDADGVARHSFTVPTDLAPGDHHLEVHAVADGEPIVTTIPLLLGDSGEIISIEGFSVSSLESVVPARLLESRSGPNATTVDGRFEGIGRVAAGSVVELAVTGRGGVPTDADAVMLNVTAVNPSGAGFVTVFPCGEERPTASNVNYEAGQVVPNAVLAQIGTDGAVCLFTLAETHLLVDANGYVPAGGTPNPVVPARLLETRTGPNARTVDDAFDRIGRVAAGSVVELTVAGRGGVPADAEAVMLNVTAVAPSTAGFVTVFPCGEERPTTSNVNYRAGQIVPNAVLAQIGTDGTVCLFTLSDTHLLVDVNGYVPSDGAPDPVVPARLLETRTGTTATTVDGSFLGGGRAAAGSTVELTVAGRGGVPDDADAVMLNVTAVDPSGAGFVTVFPCGAARPTASNVNYQSGQVVPNAVLAQIGTDGTVCLFTLAETDLVVDVNGYVGAA